MADEVATGAATGTIESSATPTAEAATSVTPPSAKAESAETSPVAASAEASSESAPAKVDPRKLYESDPDIRAFIDGKVGELSQKQLKKLLLKEKVQRAAEDPVAALEVAQSLKAEYDQEDQVAQTAVQTEQAVVGRLRAIAKADPAFQKEYNDLKDANAEEFAKAYHEDPDNFHAFALAKVLLGRNKREIAAEAKKQGQALGEAAAISMTAQALQQMPELPTGNGGSGGLPTLEQIENMSPEEYAKYRPLIHANIGRYRR